MQYQLPDHISFGFIGLHAVVLDAKADRYILLAGSQAATLAALSGSGIGGLDPARAAHLAEHGIVASGPGRCIRPVDAPEPTASALETLGETSAVRVSEVARRRFAATLSLRFGGLAATIERRRRLRAILEPAPGRPRANDRERAAAGARGFAEARLFIPAQRKCVPDSLALIDCLWRRDIAADLYFGVRLAPFAAHCWVQADDLLLSDPLDIVREFTPVFRL